MQRITRSPYATFAVQKSLEPFLNNFTGNIEVANTKGFSIGQSQIASFSSVPGHNGKRSLFALDNNLSFIVRFGGTDRLKLITVQRHFNTRSWFSALQVSCKHKRGTIFAAFHSKSEIRSQDIFCHPTTGGVV